MLRGRGLEVFLFLAQGSREVKKATIDFGGGQTSIFLQRGRQVLARRLVPPQLHPRHAGMDLPPRRRFRTARFGTVRSGTLSAFRADELAESMSPDARSKSSFDVRTDGRC